MMLRSVSTALWLQALVGVVSGGRPPLPDDGYNHFQTEPTFKSLRVKVVDSADDPSLVQPGHIFFSPFARGGEDIIGPHIIDQEGELVWYGNEVTGGRAQDFGVCSYAGETNNHLCWSETLWNTWDHEQAQKRVFDNTYRAAGRNYERAFVPHGTHILDAPNPHEYNMLPDGRSFLQAVYQLVSLDLKEYGGPKEGYIFDGCFQEINATTGEELFSWCARPHVPLWHSYIFPPLSKNFTEELYGDGTVRTPWDYFHLNAVSKTDDGDYLVSARHLNQVMKIAGTPAHGVRPGTVLWRLGGKSNDFEDAQLVDMSRQHHVRILSTTHQETVLSLFNNQWQSSIEKRISNGQIITINNQTMKVTSAKKYYNPEGHLSFAQGSTQVLSNGNVFVGWGTVPHISEFSPDGTLLSHIHLDRFTDPEPEQPPDAWNYRAFKYPWVGNPQTKPKLVAYSQSCDTAKSPLTAYVSWNGATETRHWRFYTSDNSRKGPWMYAGTFPRDGFETRATLLQRSLLGFREFPRFVSVEALDHEYQVLSTEVSETFVPTQHLNSSCDELGCFEPLWFDYRNSPNNVAMCKSTSFPLAPAGILAILFLFFLVETIQNVTVRKITKISPLDSALPQFYSEKPIARNRHSPPRTFSRILRRLCHFGKR